MTKIVFAAAAAVFVLMSAGVLTVPAWALVLGGGGLCAVLLRRPKDAGDGEVSC